MQTRVMEKTPRHLLPQPCSAELHAGFSLPATMRELSGVIVLSFLQQLMERVPVCLAE